MAILHKVRRESFVMVPQNVLYSGLSLRAVGLFAWIADQHVNSWLSARYISEQTNLGREAAGKAIRELESLGFLHRSQEVGKKSVWTLYDNPEDNTYHTGRKTDHKMDSLVYSSVDRKTDDVKPVNRKAVNKPILNKTNIEKNQNLKIDEDGARSKFLDWEEAEECVGYWNELAERFAGLTPIKGLTAHRLDLFNRVIKKFGRRALFEALANIPKSPYLLGLAVGNSQTTFVTRLDWFLTEDNFLKVWEGHYLAERRVEVSKTKREDLRRKKESSIIDREIQKNL